MPTLPTRLLRHRALRRFLTAAAGTLALLGLCASAVRADDDLEREQLARISHEIEQVQAMVAEASRRALPPQRVRFRYDWLQRDLQMLRAGIEQHVEAPRRPRPVPPLRGDYRQ